MRFGGNAEIYLFGRRGLTWVFYSLLCRLNSLSIYIFYLDWYNICLSQPFTFLLVPFYLPSPLDI